MAQQDILEQENRTLKKEVSRARYLLKDLKRRSGLSEMLIQSLPGIFYLVDGSFRFHRWNGTLERISGYSPRELKGKNGLELFEGDGLRKIRNGLQKALAHGAATEEAELVARTGARIPYLFTGTSARLKGRRYVLGTGIDLREYLRLGSALQGSECLWPKRTKSKAGGARSFFLSAGVQAAGPPGNMIGTSPAMKQVHRLVMKAAAHSANVIVYGESGTGKELFARAVHEQSNRSGRAFVPVNCAAIPENLLESEFFGYRKGAFTGAHLDKQGYLDMADGGTLFLDEIDELTELLQAKLLRAIELGEYSPVGSTELRRSDFRIISATNNEHRIRQSWKGWLRRDFFYRIHVIPVHLPPLRHRQEDIPHLVKHFLEIYSEPNEEAPPLPPHLMEAFMAHDWPGNVRELQNVIQRYLVGAELELPMVPLREPGASRPSSRHNAGRAGAGPVLRQRMRSAEKRVIQEALDRSQDNRSRAASMLGVSRMTLYRKMRSLGMI